MRAERFDVSARTASAEEKPRLWEIVNDVWPNYDVYQSRTDREIPVVVLTPGRGLIGTFAGCPPRRAPRRTTDRAPVATARAGRPTPRRCWPRPQRLVVERGDNFTTQDLIKEADVALQTFYRHFGGKDQTPPSRSSAGPDRRATASALEVHGAGIADPVERLHRYVVETLSVVGASPEPAAPGS